jgi:hypothetical protein
MNISCTCPIRNLYVYGKGGDADILLTSEDGIYLIRDDTEYLLSDNIMDRCILVNHSSVMCSKGKYLNFFNITNVSGKIEKYNGISLPIEAVLANSTNCTYAAWVSEQLNRSISTNDIEEALRIVQNISVSELLSEDCVKKAIEAVPLQNTTDGTISLNTTTGGKNGTGNIVTQAQGQIAEFPLLAIIIIAILIAAVAYLLLKRKKPRESGYSRSSK